MSALEEINVLTQQGKLEVASENCIEAAKIEYSNKAYELAAKIAIALRKQQRFSEALHLLNTLQETRPHEAKPLGFYMELGHVLRTHHQYQASLLAYQQVVEINPKHLWGRFWVAKCLFLDGKVSAAKRSLESTHFENNIAANLFGELMLLNIDIAIDAESFDELVAYYRSLSQQISTLPCYIISSMINKLCQVSRREIIFHCLITFAFRGLPPAQMFQVARLFYQINNTLLAITVLLRLKKLEPFQEYQWHLLITCVLESSDYEHGEVWHAARELVEQEYCQRENKNSYWQYWTDFWDEPTEQSIKFGKNCGVGLANTLNQFNTLFWSIQGRSPSKGGQGGIPKSVVIYSSQLGAKLPDEKDKQLQVGTDTFSVNYFNPIQASQFIAEYYNARVKRAWRLARNHNDKKHLFTLCYLVKCGGILLPAKALEKKCSLLLQSQYDFSLTFVKGMLGVSTEAMAVKPNHPLLIAIVESIVQSLLNRSRLPDLYTTGAIGWTKVLNQYCYEMQKRGKEPDVSILDGYQGEGLI